MSKAEEFVAGVFGVISIFYAGSLIFHVFTGASTIDLLFDSMWMLGTLIIYLIFCLFDKLSKVENMLHSIYYEKFKKDHS